MEINNIIIDTEDDKKLHVISHTLEKNIIPKAVIVHIHGFLQDFNDNLPNHNTHLYNFQNRIKLLEKLNVVNFALELRAHGQSSIENVCNISFNEYLLDVKAILKYISTTEYSNLPIHVLATSMGGAIIINYCIKYNPIIIKSIIVSSPLLDFEPNFKKIYNKYYLNLIKLNVMPKKKINDAFMVVGRIGILLFDVDNNSGKKLMKYNNDDLCNLINNFKSGMDYINENKHKFTKPILAFHGQNDKTTSAVGTQKFIDGCGSPDKNIIIFPNIASHPLLKETKILDELSADIYKWFDKFI